MSLSCPAVGNLPKDTPLSNGPPACLWPMLYAMIDGPPASNYSTITLLYSPVTSLSLSSLVSYSFRAFAFGFRFQTKLVGNERRLIEMA